MRKYPKIYLFVVIIMLLFLPGTEVFGQERQSEASSYTSKVDSLGQVFPFYARNNDTEKINEILSELYELAGNDTESKAYLSALLRQMELDITRENFNNVEDELLELLTETRRLGFVNLQIQVLASLAVVQNRMGQTEESKQYLSKATELSKQHNAVDEKFQIEQIRALIYDNSGNFKDALDIYYEQLRDLEQQNELKADKLTLTRMSLVYTSIAYLLTEINHRDEALLYYDKALKLSRALGDNGITVRNLNNISTLYYNLGDYKTANDSLQVALELNIQAGRKAHMIRNTYNIGSNYLSLEEYEKAKLNFEDGLQLSADDDYIHGRLYHTFGLAQTYYKLGNLARAQELFQIAEEISIQLNIKPIITNTYRQRYQLEKDLGNYETALEYHELFKVMDDEFKELVRSQALDELIITHQLESTRTENGFLAQQLVLEETASRQKTYFLLFMSLLMAITIGFAYYFFKVKRKLEFAYVALDQQKNRISYKNTRLERLSQERNGFLQVIIHDLRNPLSTIDGASQILKMNETEHTDREQKELMDIIGSASKRLNLLISSLLNVFESNSSNVEAEMEDINTGQLMREIINEYIPLARQKSIRLTSELADFEANTHPGLLNGIISNLISNAIKYSPAASEVTITSTRCAESQWEFRVRDQGPGFTADDELHLFEPFAKLSAQPTGDESATGIGLYSVKTSLERLNGTIKINKAYTQGAEFICQIPMEHAPVVKASPQKAKAF